MLVKLFSLCAFPSSHLGKTVNFCTLGAAAYDNVLDPFGSLTQPEYSATRESIHVKAPRKSLENCRTPEENWLPQIC